MTCKNCIKNSWLHVFRLMINNDHISLIGFGTTYGSYMLNLMQWNQICCFIFLIFFSVYEHATRSTFYMLHVFKQQKHIKSGKINQLNVSDLLQDCFDFHCMRSISVNTVVFSFDFFCY